MVQYVGRNLTAGVSLAQVGGKAHLFGGTPVVQPTGTAQSAVATTAITTLITTPTATDIAIAVNSLISRVDALVVLANAHRSAAVDVGVMKGSA